jgi:alpha-tubulin suppressor-like RCC1 family protein
MQRSLFKHDCGTSSVAALAALALLGACNRDSGPGTAGVPPSYFAQAIECTATVQAKTVDCESRGSAVSTSVAGAIDLLHQRRAGTTPPNVSPAILGGQNIYVKLSSQNLVIVSGSSFTFDARVQNLTPEPMGTAGTAYDGTGVNVFFSVNPTAPVTINNATGQTTFTGANQSYFNYPELVPANGATAWKSWILGLHGASVFSFTVFVSAQLPIGGPVLIPPHEFDYIAAGSYFSCATRPGPASRRAYCWGINDVGQIGDGQSGAFLEDSTPLGVLGGFQFSMIDGAATHTCALDTGGAAYCWGDNSYGQLGNGVFFGSFFTPGAVLGGLTFDSISSLAYHTCALVHGSGARGVRCWGSNYAGMIGDSSAVDKAVPTSPSGALLYTTISAGLDHTCGLIASGAAYCWGNDSLGQLGNNNSGPHYKTPQAVAGGLFFTAIGAGYEFTCAIEKTTRLMWCWGENFHFQLSNDFLPGSLVPEHEFGSQQFSSLTVGAYHSCATDFVSGDAYCWGENDFGVLGDGTNTSGNGIVPVSNVTQFSEIKAGYLHTCAITSAHVPYCWGDDFYGELGDGDPGTIKLLPTAVLVP